MKSFKSYSLALLLTLTSVFISNLIYAQDGVSPEVASLVNLKLDEGQDKLAELGYELCASSLFAKKQDWYNESSNECVTIKFHKRKGITEVLPNPNTSQCQQGLEASRKVWEKYHDGQAPISASKIDEERKKLADKGFTVSYWIDEISPGRSSEYWVNDDTQKAMFIVWEIQGNQWVMTEKTDYKRGTNPAP
jgi:hypothetical protein